MQVEVWTYRDRSQIGTDMKTADIVDYDVEALDGPIGKVDDATTEAGAGHLVVDTGPWILGKKVMLPAGVVRTVADGERKVYVNRTREQVKNAPEFDDALLADDEGYRVRLGSYYGAGGAGYRDWDDAV